MGNKSRKTGFHLAALLVLTLSLALNMSILSVQAAPAASIIYDAIPDPLPPNMASVGFQATQTSEFGDYIHLGGVNRELRTVTITMSIWALHSEYPAMSNAGFDHPITLNIYNVVAGSPLNTIGSLIATKTQTFTIPWRPEADPTCPGGTAWRAGDNQCYNGMAFNITFDLSSQNITLPDDIVVGVAYNTQSYGDAPLGVTGPYNSLNVGAAGITTIGSDDNTDNVFWNTSTAAWYADGGTGGVGIFREDTAWTPYGSTPIQITAAPVPSQVYVNETWDIVPTGQDPDGAGPASQMGYDAFYVIQDGIDAVETNGTVNVAAGTYAGAVNINRSMTIQGPQANVVVDGRTAAGISEATIQGLVTVSASNVTLNGFTLTNPGQTNALLVPSNTPSHSNITINYNIIDTIGSAALTSNVHAIYLNHGPDSVNISHNRFNNIKADNKSVSAIGVLDSVSLNSSENLVIQNNIFSDISSNTKGAYGIIINNATGAPDAQIMNNSFSGLNGGWTHAIGLEGPTNNAIVTGNIFSNLTALGTDNAAILFEKNPAGNTVTILQNQFNGTAFYGVAIHPNDLPGGSNGLNYTVTAEKNWWFSISGPGSVGTGTGALVGLNVDYSPWCTDATCTAFVPPFPPVITEGAVVNVTMSKNGFPNKFNLTLNATDGDGDTLTWSISNAASNGTATASGTGTSKAIGYTPALNFSGVDSFIVQVADGTGGIDTITINVTVSAGGDFPTFSDVQMNSFAWAQIESIYAAGITGGCSTNPLNFCPNNSVTRSQMAVFLLRGIHGAGYTPPTATGTVFGDVPANSFAADWIEQLVAEGITSGCGNGNYCPNSTVTRAQIAVFLLRAKHGSGYTPPVAAGTVFTDVPANAFAAAWIEQLVAEGITSGCGNGIFCPNNSVTRAQMAIFLQRTFNLPMP